MPHDRHPVSRVLDESLVYFFLLTYMCFAQEKCNYDINKKRNNHKYTIFSHGFEYKSKPNSLEYLNMIMTENVSLEFQTNQMMIKKKL